VAVFGGGVAGLTAAHELAERGFDVTVYERRAWGGKARSSDVPGTAIGGRKPLPGEHGFRFVLGFYRNLPETLRRIPYGPNTEGVLDNLRDAPDTVLARDGARPDLYLPTDATDPLSLAPERIVGTVMHLFANPRLPPQATAHFANRLVVYLSSCDERRHQQWERTTWSKFIDTDRYPGDYKIFDELPRFGQASKGLETSTDWIGQAAEALLLALSGRGYAGVGSGFWRLLNGPTNETWIGPWLAQLQRLGARLRLHHEVTGFDMRGGRITAAHVRTPRGHRTVHADWYVCALPVERARALWSAAIIAADPKLEQMHELSVAWMNGMKLFLSENRPLAHGPIGYMDGPWAMASVNQAQFWDADFASTYGDGRVHDSLSAIVSDWSAPGVIYGKPARECTPNEIIHEVWQQIKRAANKPGEPPKLTDDLLLSWNIDPGMRLHDGHLVSGDPLNVPRVGERPYRPDVVTGIPNLLLAGDYVLTDWLVGTMEAANETGRRAANAILEKSNSAEPRAAVIRHDRLPEWAAQQEIDAVRYARGQSNVFDIR
jgi:uncharacterized protein with NAD-binding domain and iron-sulfur cluster